jgi:hypothetical protein
MNATESIDVVVMWVDGGDRLWQKEKSKWQGDEQKQAHIDVSSKRYRDWNNLQYLFRGIETFMPWVRKVHFVTNGQKPAWLNLKCNKLNWVRHEDFMPKSYLPTFSANPIELNLHRIKGLSEKFIFFNDDMFVVSPLKPSDFFRNGLPCDQSTLLRITSPDYDEIFWHIVLNDISVINRNFDKWTTIKRNSRKMFSPKNGALSPVLSASYLPLNHLPGFLINHIPQPFLKSTFAEVWKKEGQVLDSVSRHRFRDVMDVNQYLMKWWQFCSGRYAPINRLRTTKNFSIFPAQTQELVKAIEGQKYQMICINDAEVEDFEATKQVVVHSFDKILSKKSEFEK